jgi:pimeloyl-ACP methyl ester carboxylesterase
MRPDQAEFRFIETNGLALRAVVKGSGPLVLLVHGFPELWYSWRHQIDALSAAGFTVCALDVRGYGGSAKPQAVEAYSMKELTADMAGAIAALSPNEPAVIVGHDWGAPIAWYTALLHPDRVRAVAGLSVPYFGLPPAPFIQIARQIYTAQGKFFYQVYFQDEGVAEAEFEADVKSALRKIYYTASGDSGLDFSNLNKKHGDQLLPGLIDPDPFPAWLSQADIDYFAAEFTRSGFRGPLNRYRNFERDHADLSQRTDHVIKQPALFIAGDRDLVLRIMPGADLVARMADTLADLRAAHILPGIGHWTQQEAPDQVSGLLIDWLAEL